MLADRNVSGGRGLSGRIPGPKVAPIGMTADEFDRMVREGRITVVPAGGVGQSGSTQQVGQVGKPLSLILSDVLGTDINTVYELARDPQGGVWVRRDPSGRLVYMRFRARRGAGGDRAGSPREFAIMYDWGTGDYRLSVFGEDGSPRIAHSFPLKYDPISQRFYVVNPEHVEPLRRWLSTELLGGGSGGGGDVSGQSAPQPRQPSDPASRGQSDESGAGGLGATLFYRFRLDRPGAGQPVGGGQSRQSLTELLMPLLVMLAMRGRGGGSGSGDDMRPIVIG